MKKLFLLAATTLLTSAVFAQKDDKKITDATVNKAKIESHIYFLASDELKGRQTPSPEQLIAARYLTTQLQSYGVKPLPAYPDYLQPVAMRTVSAPSEVTVAYNNTTFLLKESTLKLDGENISLDAEGIFLNYGTEEDFKSADVKGKVIIVKAGLPQQTNPRAWMSARQEKAKRATEKGAVGIIELYANQQLPWKLLTSYFKGGSVELDESTTKAKPSLTHIWLHDPEGKEAVYWTDSKKAKVQIKISGIAEKKFNTYNIVGYVEGTDAKLKNEYIAYSAHYDHIGVGNPNEKGDTIYNGARDNAVGSVTVLSAAENLAKYPTKRSALFILFTGEEKGLLGSRWFVEHSPLELNKIVYCFNSDNAGYNDTSIATIIGLGRTTAEGFIKKACETYGLKATDDPAPEQGLFDRSDNVNFAKKGIPAPTFSMGFTSFSGDVTKFYHQASDEPSTLDYNYLYKFFSAYVYSCRMIGNAPARPFWKTGDKYFDAGTQLYK
ncbi:M28 family peptidase [Cytophagaceae bacterium DM2B3-1]|uniref:M28 family peptidase n=1 Tax=Xanthocytophaga flava TaxID=3048013 RepID=A0ABT7CKZ5_9BACT|nr:M28 family peptidase [Xanthocytophaga flavus]MDJ1494433.1 M28 family peptidase [Xanthocytophaga flavus]